MNTGTNADPSNLPLESLTAHSSSSAPTYMAVCSGPPPVNSYTYRTVAIRELRDYTQHLCGRIKTIIDAAVTDPRQNKAFKDLVHDAFWTEHYRPAMEWCDRVARQTSLNSISTDEPFPFSSAQQPDHPPVGTV